jgi:hypothetical protein
VRYIRAGNLVGALLPGLRRSVSSKGETMPMQFELPLLTGDSTVDDAFATMIDSKKSGVFCRPTRGDLRVVGFHELEQAAKDGVALLQDVQKSQRVLDVASTFEAQYVSSIKSAGAIFGLVATLPGTAVLLSVFETSAQPFMGASPGVRCQREPRPTSQPPKQWYHYYPPKTLDPSDPHTCKYCGFPIP